MTRTIGERVRLCRARSGFTQRELSNLTRLSMNLLVRIESGRLEPRLSHAHRLALVFGVTIEYLATGKQPDYPVTGQEAALLSAHRSIFGAGIGQAEYPVKWGAGFNWKHKVADDLSHETAFKISSEGLSVDFDIKAETKADPHTVGGEG